MPHGTETLTEEQRESPFVKDAAWQRKYKDIVLVPCKPITTDILTSLYRREGICKHSVVPCENFVNNSSVALEARENESATCCSDKWEQVFVIVT